MYLPLLLSNVSDPFIISQQIIILTAVKLRELRITCCRKFSNDLFFQDQQNLIANFGAELSRQREIIPFF